MFGETPTQNNEGDIEEPMEKDSSSFLKPKNAKGTEQSPEVCGQEHLINVNQIIGALNLMPPSNAAGIIKKHCPNVLSAIGLLISEEVSTACKKLCRRSDGSVLYGNYHESLKEFNFDSVWDEMERNIPFVITLMNNVAGKDSITADLQVKYSFLYSILMSERWHELGLLKRVITVGYRGWMYKKGEAMSLNIFVYTKDQNVMNFNPCS